MQGEKKTTRSIRMKPSIIAKIEEKWGTVQKWIDFNVNTELGEQYETIVEKRE